MNRFHLLFSVLFARFLTSCDSSSSQDQFDGKEVQFEFLDSVVVESLSELYLSAKNEKTGQLVFKERFLKEFLLTDSLGRILKKPELKGEGPNQVNFPMELAFMGEQLVVKEISAEMRLSFFDQNFNKIKTSPALAKGLNMVEISNTRLTFSVFEGEGTPLILGTETNGIDPMWMTSENQKPEFYEQAEAGFLYNPVTDSLMRFNLYPAGWQPKKDNQWVGQALPFISILSSEKVAVLPRIGEQLFFYTLAGQQLIPDGEIKLKHPERKGDMKVDSVEPAFLYPAFTDIKGGGNYFLVEFHTEIPLEIFQEFRAKSEDYMSDPEFKQMFKKYRVAKYILVDPQGNQGTISSLPLEGTIHYFDANDVIYIKPESKEEKDYNVFYRYQVKM